MKYDASYHILRVGMAITFLWIGVLILQDPIGWSGFISPWAQNLLPISPVEVMYGTAILDIAVGFFLLINVKTWIASLLGGAHLAGVLVVSGIDAVTVRDIGLLTAIIALFWISLPQRYKKIITKKAHPETSKS